MAAFFDPNGHEFEPYVDEIIDLLEKAIIILEDKGNYVVAALVSNALECYIIEELDNAIFANESIKYFE